MEKLETLKKLIADVENDFSKLFEKDQKAAGTRIRKAMQDIKKTSQEIRQDVLDKVHAINEAAA